MKASETTTGARRILANVSDKFEHEDINFNSLDFVDFMNLANSIVDDYAELNRHMKNVENLCLYGFKGEVAEAINELLRILPTYLDDYSTTISELAVVLRNLNYMSEELSIIKIIKEIECI